MVRLACFASLLFFGCGSNPSSSDDGGAADIAGPSSDAAFDSSVMDGSSAVDATSTIDGPAPMLLGSVSNVMSVACPGAAPGGSTCKQVTVGGCPGLAAEPLVATLAILAPTGTLKGTVVHFNGGGGTGFENGGSSQYAQAGLQQVFVSWVSAWEQTQSLGTKAAGCRPATLLNWVWGEPTLHNGSRTIGFCGQGFSGGSGQLGYSLAQYGLGGYLDYVNELSGPPFARIDLGCDYSAPATAMVCGVADTMQLPAPVLNPWEHTTTCGSMNPPVADVAKWKNDSIAVGGAYAYPNTRVEFFDCTNQATAVTAMAQIYYQQIVQAEGGMNMTAYHCYSAVDGCMGEGLGSGGAAAFAAMVAGCVPRH